MKPAFALNLSPDGISLLHRTSRGWLLVGAVALDDPDVPAALGYLRKTALGLAPQGFTTKLILPASQILYTAVEAPGPDAANRRRQIARALEGRTPYAAEDLVFDWSGTGGRVNVAVVARETLEEAEAFAQEHRFNPVSFVAMPEDGTFAGEPFFGQTAKARSYIPEGERLVRDQDPVRIAGDADLARLAATSVAERMVEEAAPAEAPAAEQAVSDAAAPATDDSEIVAAVDPVIEETSAETVAQAPVSEADVAAAAVLPGGAEADIAPDAVAPDAEVEPAANLEPEETGVEAADAEPLAADEPLAEDMPAEAPVEAGPADAGMEPIVEAATEPEAETPEAEAPEAETVDPPAAAAAEPAPEVAPAEPTDPREERRRARAERREREAAERAEAEAAAALARQPSFGFAAPVVAAQDEPERPLAGVAAEAQDLPAASAQMGAAPSAAGAPAPFGAGISLEDEHAAAHGAAEDAAFAPTAGEPGAEDAEEAPFLAVEDEAEAAMPAPAPLPPELDADGVPTPFAAAATLSPAPAMPGPRLRLGPAAPETGRATPAKLAGDSGSVISPRLGIAAEPRAEARTEPATRAKSHASGLGKAVIAAGKMAKAAKNARVANRRVEAAPGPAAPRSRTSSEAEALTVFGARRGKPARGKPRYLGLMLTAALVFLMLAVALWSSLLEDTPTAGAPASEPVADAAPARTAAVESLAVAPDFEDVPTVDAIEADAMTEAEIAADGGFEAMEAPADEMAEAPTDLPTDLPVDLPVDLPEDLPTEPEDGLAGQLADDLAAAPETLPQEAPVPGSTAPDAAAAAAIAAAGVGAAGELANGLAAADIATAAPEVPADAAGGPVPDASEGLPPRPADPAVTERSAEALLDTTALTADPLPAPPQPPLPYGTGFQFGEDGLVVATPDGALTPEGVTVVAGAPTLVPPARPAAVAAAAAEAVPPAQSDPAAAEAAVAEAVAEGAAAPEAGSAVSVPDPALAGVKPLPRPASLEVPAAVAPEAAAETPADTPAAAEDGASLPAPLVADPALAAFKPRAASTVAVAAAAAARSAEEARAAEQAALQEALASATASAVASSRKPLSRPQDFSRGVEAALAMAATTAPVIAAAAPPPQPAPVAAAPTRQAAVAPAPVEPEEMDEPEPIAAAPNIPTTASVAKQATISGAISLREINLIGVYGASSNRRALVRLANGRMLRVKIGDRIDGGQVTGIGEGQLTYQKGGRTHVLRMIQQS
ncbi:hypothetical protein GVY41_12715 [Frigidibacter albus]|uniref:Translation initiation factor 2 n=1 Tax=Frigidibacter albus TaxID=1465486 RepID=A0A6L8VJ85_9RHOB|nr:hypothetical protein [Frigidibacter albus]MZQ89766.1 hypothetical protein [Frigidibacter albus]NBE31859.1 hypothetical protein [Frigidibacter albus]GGH56776.1 hypothetical protein GCM10011341_25580 [Frigidibacter albus]